jgi:pimeloyl-ACP methyl ester carboxylesterase
MPDADTAPRVISPAQPEESWTTVDGVRMRYLRAGSGPPLILLHGLLGYSFSWRFNIPAFARYRTVYAVDMPGAGFSERSANLDCSFRGSALRLLRFAENLGLSSFDLLATSHGGAVAVLAAATANQGDVRRVQRLVLVAPVNPWSAHGRRLAPFLGRPLVSAFLGWCIPYLNFANGVVVRRLYGDPQRISPGTVEGYSKPYSTSGSLDYFFSILRTWNRDLDDLECSLAETADVPVLLIWGSRDAAVDPASARTLSRHFRNCERVEFPGVGHLPYEEVPSDFNTAVIKFLSA